MKKLIFLFLLIPFIGISQVSTGQEQDFDYGLRNNAAQTVTTPVYLCTQGMDNTIGIIPSAYIEKTANKQNNLNYDGTGAKYPTVDGVNAWASGIAKVATKTGLLSKLDTFNLIPLTNSTLRISPVASAMFWDELFVPSTAPISAIKSFAQKDYVLTELVTATGGNVNTTPLTTDGKYVRYLAYDKNGNVYSSATNFLTNTGLLQLGFVTVLKTGASVEFLDGTTGPRHVLAQPALASNTEFDKVASTTTNVAVGRKSNASISTTNGTITGISVNWKSAANPTNSEPIDVFNYAGQTTASFVAIDPTFLTSTSAITGHTLLTELDGGIAVNESFYNTTTGLRGTMANGSASVARIMVGVRGGIFWQMGEFSSTACYADLATAKSNIYSHVFSDAIVPPGVAYEIARVAFTKGVTVTNSDTQFYLVNTGGGSGGSTTIPPVSDATVATKGILKLAGDFDATSTSDLPIIKSASASQNGLITTGTQTITGNKTLTASLFVEPPTTGIAIGAISQDNIGVSAVSASTTLPALYAESQGTADIAQFSNGTINVANISKQGDLTAKTINFRNIAGTFTSAFTNSNTASRTYTLPDKSGTVSLLTDLPLESGFQQLNQASYTLALTDAFSTIYNVYNSGAMSLIVPTNASVAFSLGTKINIAISNGSGGTLTISGAGVTFIAPEGLLLRYKGWLILTKVGTDTWYVQTQNTGFTLSSTTITTGNSIASGNVISAGNYLVTPQINNGSGSNVININTNGTQLTNTLGGKVATMTALSDINTFNPISGVTTYGSFGVSSTINQTGGSSGITRGFYCNPTLTSAFDFRALDLQKGSVVLPYSAQSSTYNVSNNDYLLDFTSGTFNATLPTAVGCQGKHYVLKNSGSGIITIDTTSSQTIDGASTYSLSVQYKHVTVVSNGANWIIISNN